MGLPLPVDIPIPEGGPVRASSAGATFQAHIGQLVAMELRMSSLETDDTGHKARAGTDVDVELEGDGLGLDDGLYDQILA